MFLSEGCRCTEPQLPLQGSNFYKVPPLSKWWNLYLLPLVISFFLSPYPPPLSTPPQSPPFFPNGGPSGWLLIYKCLCVLKCWTKGAGLWPLGVPTLCRFIVRRWERGFATETPGHWPTHIPEPCHSCAQRCMSPRSSHCFSGNNSLTPLLSLSERKQLSNFPLNVAWCKPRQTFNATL